MIYTIFTWIFSPISFIASLSVIVIILKNGHRRVKPEDEIATSCQEAILITGCDSGNGLELAKYVLDETEYQLICCFDSIESKGYKELGNMSMLESDRLFVFRLDTTSPKNISSIVGLVNCLKGCGTSLVAIVNNAGVPVYGDFDWLAWEQIQSQIEVNLLGTLRLIRELLPYVIESRGRVINVSNVSEATVFAGLSVYSASTSALLTFFRGLGYELRKFGVSVITLRLGDFAWLSSIMASHEAYRDEMWGEMDPRERNSQGHSFRHSNGNTLNLTRPTESSDPSMFVDFRRALLSKHPQNLITCAPLGFRFMYFIVGLFPSDLKYRSLDFLLQNKYDWDVQDRLSAADCSG